MITWLANTFDTWKKITGGILAVVAFVGACVSGAVKLNQHWVLATVYAADVEQLRGQLNYQVNELKLENARTRLQQANAKQLEFSLKPTSERDSEMGRRYGDQLQKDVDSATKEVHDLEEALKNQRTQIGPSQ